MKKIFIVCLVMACALVVSSCSGHKSKGPSSVTTTTEKAVIATEPVPTFKETETTELIPNPCEALTIEHVGEIITESTIRGPIFQTASAPSKTCEWSVEKTTTPRLGVSIAYSSTYFNSAEADKQADAKVGDKSFIVKKYVTALGGSECGRTIIVSTGKYSFTVSVCKANNLMPSVKELSELANDVINSLP